jgi:hypothetical protein
MKTTGLYTAFADLAADDDGWFSIVEDLLSTAEALEPMIREYWEEEKRREREISNSGTFLIFTYNPDPREIYFMLMAYAIENACRMAADRDLSLGSSQDSSNDLVQGRARPQKELGLESPNRHLYERAPIGYKAHTSGHALYKDVERAANVISE